MAGRPRRSIQMSTFAQASSHGRKSTCQRRRCRCRRDSRRWSRHRSTAEPRLLRNLGIATYVWRSTHERPGAQLENQHAWRHPIRFAVLGIRERKLRPDIRPDSKPRELDCTGLGKSGSTSARRQNSAQCGSIRFPRRHSNRKPGRELLHGTGLLQHRSFAEPIVRVALARGIRLLHASRRCV